MVGRVQIYKTFTLSTACNTHPFCNIQCFDTHLHRWVDAGQPQARLIPADWEPNSDSELGLAQSIGAHKRHLVSSQSAGWVEKY